MGRVKLQIKKIENTTNRQVTYSKRRNGLIKKAYELSILCDIDIALLMFSPSGRLSMFSGNKRIEDVLERYVNLPEHERGRPNTVVSQIEDLQLEVNKFRNKVEELEKKLRIFEGDSLIITSVHQAEYHEHVLEEALNCVRSRKEVLEQQQDLTSNSSTEQIFCHMQNVHSNGFLATSPHHAADWLSQRDTQSDIFNFLDLNGLLPLRSLKLDDI
ncbi:hypothetical protein H6P81_020398 [Aristolochia fimbriata]|uniref:MADS-box domain-containing protein n=1 Tax=Aristolochia fimbriata TaxID=158543 RepID=A0AAV7DVA8_ARIFI|nr:hypothetical protein H6P81_020398 [Aristolochia fimbriata]